jgi:hypothetical protein
MPSIMALSCKGSALQSAAACGNPRPLCRVRALSYKEAQQSLNSNVQPMRPAAPLTLTLAGRPARSSRRLPVVPAASQSGSGGHRCMSGPELP